MASTFILKRKTFDDGQGSGWGKKLAIGAATLGTAAGGFAMARHGVLGGSLQRSANRAWMRAGRQVGKVNTNWGASMQKSALDKYTEGSARVMTDAAERAGKTINKAKIDTVAKAQADVMQDKINRVGLWSKDNQAAAAELRKATDARKQMNSIQIDPNLKNVDSRLQKRLDDIKAGKNVVKV